MTAMDVLRALVRSEQAAMDHHGDCSQCRAGNMCAEGQKLVMVNLEASLLARVTVDRADGVHQAFPKVKGKPAHT